MIPDFSEFAFSIKEEEIAKALQERFPPHLLQFQSDDPKSLETALQMTINYSAQAAAASSAIILQRYHEWLQSIL